MQIKRIASGVLTLVLLALLGSCINQGIWNIRALILLILGSICGAVYTIYGQIPEWMIILSGGSLVADDDPGNISPRVYLPILAVIIAISALAIMSI